jgi:hypothetical protein
MSQRHSHIVERVKVAREQAMIGYVHGKQIDRRVQAAREQAIIRYGYGKRG